MNNAFCCPGGTAQALRSARRLPPRGLNTALSIREENTPVAATSGPLPRKIVIDRSKTLSIPPVRQVCEYKVYLWVCLKIVRTSLHSVAPRVRRFSHAVSETTPFPSARGPLNVLSTSTFTGGFFCCNNAVIGSCCYCVRERQPGGIFYFRRGGIADWSRHVLIHHVSPNRDNPLTWRNQPNRRSRIIVPR